MEKLRLRGQEVDKDCSALLPFQEAQRTLPRVSGQEEGLVFLRRVAAKPSGVNGPRCSYVANEKEKEHGPGHTF